MENFENAKPAPAFTGRTLPNSQEAEEYLLSCCFLDGPEVLNRCIIAGITPLHFYLAAHGIVYGVMLDLLAAQRPTEPHVVAEELKTRKLLDQAGGYAFISQCSARIPTTAQAGYFMDKVLEQHRLREIINRATGLVEDCHNYTGGDLAAEFGPKIERLASALHDRESVRTWAAAVNEAEAITKERMKAPLERKMDGRELSWGIADLDRYFLPLEPGELVVVGGYTSSGKSSLLRQILWGLAASGTATLLETIEVRDAEEAVNLASHISGIRSRSRLDELHRKEKEELLAAFDKMRVKHFAVGHTDHNLAAMLARVLAFKRKVPLRAWGADYLQILEDIKNLRPGEREDTAIGRVTSAMKRFSTTENLVTFLLSGFNREYIKSESGRDPKLSDLAGSSHIEKDASRVLLLHIPTEYILNGQKCSQSLTADSADQPQFFVKLIQGKGRNQGTASVGLFFRRETKTFHAIARE